MPASIEPILVAGSWRAADTSEPFRAVDPTTGSLRDAVWPVSTWADVAAALDAAVDAAAALERVPDAARGDFLDRYAARLEAQADEIVAAAHAETGLAVRPRLADVEYPRMLDQLRQAAATAREGSWRMPMIDTRNNIRSLATGLGPVVVFPPANFPLAYGAVTGGDFAAAIAGGNPVVAKAHPGCPTVSRLAAEGAQAALAETGLPAATVQLLHGISVADGLRLVADPRVGATGFTGSEPAGRALYAAASAAGRVIWVEMGSLNPVVLLPGAVAERAATLAADLTASVTGSAGQFCTKPGLVFFLADAAAPALVARLRDSFTALEPQVLLGPGGRDRLGAAVAELERAGATVIARRIPEDGITGGGCTHPPTLLEVSGGVFRAGSDPFLVEAFGNATLLVACADLDELLACVSQVRGSLGASLYAAHDGRDDAVFPRVAAALTARAGRIIENRMPTGLTVTAPMQHGGPWPSAAPPFFSAVGFPFTALRFARRVCFDGWSQPRLPECLRDEPPPSRPWRFMDGTWQR
jgi:NADP-dependent aldehyde dehydrogenase